MDIKKIMSVDIDNLIETQHEELKKYTIDRLQTVIELIHLEMYDKVDKYLAHSPAGDGYGCNNDYINFNYDDEDRDIAMIVSELDNLKLRIK